MSAPEKVECDGCGLRVALRRDDTYAKHGYMSHGVKTVCAKSGQPYARHSASFRIVDRNPNVWLGECRCGQNFLGPEYADVERPWLAHAAEAQAVSA
jgi:hypothetical protein